MKAIQNLNFVISFFLIFSFLNAFTYACYFSKKSKFSECVHDGMDEIDIKSFNITDTKKLKSNNLRCAILELLEEKVKHITYFNKKEFYGNRAKPFIDLLEARYKTAIDCIESIEETQIKRFEKAVKCCSGKKSHFGLPPWKWENDDYAKYFKNCMDENN